MGTESLALFFSTHSIGPSLPGLNHNCQGAVPKPASGISTRDSLEMQILRAPGWLVC